jgi:hypothetical protein
MGEEVALLSVADTQYEMREVDYMKGALGPKHALFK